VVGVDVGVVLVGEVVGVVVGVAGPVYSSVVVVGVVIGVVVGGIHTAVTIASFHASSPASIISSETGLKYQWAPSIALSVQKLFDAASNLCKDMPDAAQSPAAHESLIS
jgi:hypothetical protein